MAAHRFSGLLLWIPVNQAMFHGGPQYDRKSTHVPPSDSGGANDCVEIAELGVFVAVRDPKRGDLRPLVFGWKAIEMPVAEVVLSRRSCVHSPGSTAASWPRGARIKSAEPEVRRAPRSRRATIETWLHSGPGVPRFTRSAAPTPES
ncbi:DUF397 domain-containing protein [Streptomyces sp. NBC_01217]|nr:DUF397 domain-containing protein [Streptomyces sp. NBC_01217]